MSLQRSDRGVGREHSTIGRLVRVAIRQRVDDAVVLLQNIHRHIEDGLSPIEAALTAQREGADNHWRVSSTGSKAPFRREVL